MLVPSAASSSFSSRTLCSLARGKGAEASEGLCVSLSSPSCGLKKLQKVARTRERGKKQVQWIEKSGKGKKKKRERRQEKEEQGKKKALRPTAPPSFFTNCFLPLCRRRREGELFTRVLSCHSAYLSPWFSLLTRASLLSRAGLRVRVWKEIGRKPRDKGKEGEEEDFNSLPDRQSGASSSFFERRQRPIRTSSWKEALSPSSAFLLHAARVNRPA